MSYCRHVRVTEEVIRCPSKRSEATVFRRSHERKQSRVNVAGSLIVLSRYTRQESAIFSPRDRWIVVDTARVRRRGSGIEGFYYGEGDRGRSSKVIHHFLPFARRSSIRLLCTRVHSFGIRSVPFWIATKCCPRGPWRDSRDGKVPAIDFSKAAPPGIGFRGYWTFMLVFALIPDSRWLRLSCLWFALVLWEVSGSIVWVCCSKCRITKLLWSLGIDSWLTEKLLARNKISESNSCRRNTLLSHQRHVIANAWK